MSSIDRSNENSTHIPGVSSWTHDARMNAYEEKKWQIPFWSPARRAASVR